MSAQPRTVIYHDEQHDDFAGVSRRPITVGEHFPFRRKNPLWNAAAWVLYRWIMMPVAYLYCRLRLHLRVENRQVLRQVKGGYFLYGNHTQLIGDAFIPNILNAPRRTYVIVHPDNIAQRGLKNFILMNGGIPLPTERRGYRGFLEAVESRLLHGCPVTIYPEAHVWPYYTGIRPFSDAAFAYPVRFDVPVFCSTVTYQRRRHGERPRLTVYVDGPFQPDQSLPERARREALQQQVLETMRRRAQASTYAYITYIKEERP